MVSENYYLDNDEWKYDKLPEIMNGKNVYDFIDPEIEAKLNALEEEEERLEGEGFYDSDEEIVPPHPPTHPHTHLSLPPGFLGLDSILLRFYLYV
jgi:hypothetical protein